MPSVQLAKVPLQISLDYAVGPARLTSLTITNRNPFAVTVRIKRSNGAYVTFNVPALTIGGTFALTSSQFAFTVDASNNLTAAPNIETL